MKMEIKSWSGKVLYSAKATSLRELVILEVKDSADLSSANLSGANLSSADLSSANLSGANLSSANLYGANLHGANLHSANLRGADLRSANLSGANLYGADLSSADLRSANLRGADLTPVRDDLWAVLSSVPAEAHGLLDALRAGRVNGSAYQGDCACLVGTVANIRQCSYTEIPGLVPDSSRPAEEFFLAIRICDTPETSEPCRIAAEWVSDWITRMQSAFAKE